MTNEHTSLEKDTSHTLCERVAKGLCVRGELETEQTTTYWPQVPLTIAALLSHSAGLLNRGSWRPKPSVGSWFSLPRPATWTPTNWLQLTRTVCGTGLYNSLTSTCSLWASHLHRIQPLHSQGYILMSLTGCTYSLIDNWVECQYVTVVAMSALLYGCSSWTLIKHLEIKLGGHYTRILHAVLNNSLKQHPTKQQL